MTNDRRRERVEWLVAEFAQLHEGLGEVLGPNALPRAVRPDGEDGAKMRELVGGVLMELEDEKDYSILLATVMSVAAYLIDDHGHARGLAHWERRALAVFLAGLVVDVLDVVESQRQP